MTAEEHCLVGEGWLSKADEAAKPGRPRTEAMDYAVLAQAHFLAALAAVTVSKTEQGES